MEKDQLLQRINNDDAFIEFTSFEGFNNFLYALKQKDITEWEVTQEDIEFSSLHAVNAPKLIQMLQGMPESDYLYMIYKNNVYKMRSCSYISALQQCGVTGSSLKKLKLKDLAFIMNKCYESAKQKKGKSLIYRVGDSISALLGKDYRIIEQYEIYNISNKYIMDNYPDNKFINSSWEHIMTQATWIINDNNLLREYKELLSKNFYEVNDISAAVSISTSNISISGVNIYPKLYIGKEKKELPIGSPIVLNHKGTASLEKFYNNLKQLFSKFNESKGFEHLFKIKIKHPINCMLSIMHNLSISKDISYKAAETYKLKHNESPCNAYDLFLAICEVLFFARISGVKGKSMIDLEEKVARAISIDWETHDIFQFTWGNKK